MVFQHEFTDLEAFRIRSFFELARKRRGVGAENLLNQASQG
jgi:hypothetical protein